MEGGPAVMVATKQLLQSDHKVPTRTRGVREGGGGGGDRGRGTGRGLVRFVLPHMENGQPVVHVQLCGKKKPMDIIHVHDLDGTTQKSALSSYETYRDVDSIGIDFILKLRFLIVCLVSKLK